MQITVTRYADARNTRPVETIVFSGEVAEKFLALLRSIYEREPRVGDGTARYSLDAIG